MKKEEAEHIFSKLVKVGPNSYILSKVTGLPSARIKLIIDNLTRSHGLLVSTLISTESLGLRKAIVICSNSRIKMETKEKLFYPIAHIFRHDVEENKFFVVVYYVNDGLSKLQEVVKALKEKQIADCEVLEINGTKRYIVKPSCIDFEKGRNICEEKIVISGKSSEGPYNAIKFLTKRDVDFLTTLQRNPGANYLLYPRWRLIKGLIEGFFYKLGKFSFIIDVFSDDELPPTFPNLVWSAKTERGYVSEAMVNHDDLERVVKLARQYSKNVLIVPATPSFAAGYSIPYEIFRGDWKFPKIIITNS